MSRGNSLLAKAALLAITFSAGNIITTAAGPGRSFGPAPMPVTRQISWSGGPAYSSFGYGYYSPFIYQPSSPPAVPYLPNSWWTGGYGADNVQQVGYNPSAGYRWEDVTTLILATTPQKAEITLDGNPIGSACDLGPIQLPPGDHTLRVEAAGFEPSETVLKANQASVRRLQINLSAAASSAKPSK